MPAKKKTTPPRKSDSAPTPPLAALPVHAGYLAQSFHLSPSIMLLARLPGAELIEVNDTFTRLSGYTRAEAIGRTTLDLGVWTDLAERQHFLEKIHKTGQVRDFEARFRMRGGAERWLSLTADIVQIEGQPCMLTVGIDVTDRHRRELLQETTYRISEAANASGDLPALFRRLHELIGNLMPARNLYFALLNSDGQEVSFPYFQDERSACPAPRPRGKGLTDFVIDSKQALLARQEELRRRLKEQGYTPTGTPSAVWLGAPLVVGGQAIGVIAVQDYRDETVYGEEDKRLLTFVAEQAAAAVERRRTEDALRQSEADRRASQEYFIKSFHASPAMMVIARLADGRILEANAAFFTNSGHTREQAVGKTSFELNIWPDAGQRAAIIERLRRDGFVRNHEAVLLNRAGQHRYVIVNADIVEFTGDRCYIITAIDITERRQREREQAAIYRISAAAQDAADQAGLFTRVHAIIGELLSAKSFFIALYDDKTGLVSFPLWNNSREPQPPLPRTLRRGLTDYVLLNPQPLLVTENQLGDFSRRTGHSPMYGKFASFLAVPLLSGGKPVGVISLQDVDDRNAYRPEDAQFLTFVAGQLVAALQRVQIEAARKESREYFAKSFHTSPAIMLLVGLESGRIIEANTAFLRASGFAREEIVGARSLDLGIWPDPAEREKVLARLQQTGAVHGYETRLLNKSGEPRYVLLNVDRIELSGSPSMLITAIDITERRRAEEAVRKAEARYRGIFENALEGLYTSTPEGRFLNVNPAFARMLGYATPADLLAQVGDIAREFYADSKRRDEFFRLLGLADEITDFESQVYGRDGRKIWISESVRAVRDADGRLDHLEGVAVDITAQRETARALQIAKEAADTANRAKSHFLASMSHELRTPLNGILGYTQILRRDAALTDKQRAGLGIIQDSADHLLALINDVLDLAKIEARKLELHPTDFDLPAFARAVADFFLPRAREKNLLLEANIARDLPRHVRGDVPRLRQVCYNLLSNAVKFTARGSVIFSVERSGDRLRFSVSDTGPGISPDDQALLFEPFAQIGDQSRHAEGTGLGLNVSRGIVEQMGGQLRLDSRPGWGSRFWFEIALPSATAAEAVATDAGARRVTGYLGARRKLLVADDHDANRQLLRDLLEPLGFEVRDAPDGTVAVQVARTWQPDLVLLDLKMPRLDGFAAARAIRKALPDATTKIIGMSASAFDSDRQACLDAGCAEFLPKPLREAQLLAALERQLSLVWQYTDGGETVSPFPAMEHAPEIADAEAIHDLACKGDVVAVRAYAQKLAERDPRLAPFAQAVTDLAARFKMKAIRQFVGRYRKDGSGRPFL